MIGFISYELRKNEDSNLHCRLKLDSIENAQALTDFLNFHKFNITPFPYINEYIHFVSDDIDVMRNFISVVNLFSNHLHYDMRNYFAMKLKDLESSFPRKYQMHSPANIDLVDAALEVGSKNLIIKQQRTDTKAQDNPTHAPMRRSARANSIISV